MSGTREQRGFLFFVPFFILRSSFLVGSGPGPTDVEGLGDLPGAFDLHEDPVIAGFGKSIGNDTVGGSAAWGEPRVRGLAAAISSAAIGAEPEGCTCATRGDRGARKRRGPACLIQLEVLRRLASDVVDAKGEERQLLWTIGRSSRTQTMRPEGPGAGHALSSPSSGRPVIPRVSSDVVAVSDGAVHQVSEDLVAARRISGSVCSNVPTAVCCGCKCHSRSSLLETMNRCMRCP